MVAGKSALGCASVVALLISVCVIPVSAFAAPWAEMARSLELSETAHLHRTSGSLLHLNEQGTAAGTIHGTVYLHLRVGSGQTFTAEVNFYPNEGSLSGYGSGHYHLVRSGARFSGSLSITRGTGRYVHAGAHDLSFKGSIQRSNESVIVTLYGTLRY